MYAVWLVGVALRRNNVLGQETLRDLDDDWTKLGFVESVRYDEATSLLAAEQLGGCDVSRIDEACLYGPDPEIAADLSGLSEVLNDRKHHQENETGPVKVMQHESFLGCALAKRHEGAPSEYLLLTSQPCNTPARIERTNANTLTAVLQRLSLVTWKHLSGFPFRCRMVCSDRYAAQKLAERRNRKHQDNAYILRDGDCEVHCISSASAAQRFFSKKEEKSYV